MTKTEYILLGLTEGEPIMSLERLAKLRDIDPRTLQNSIYAKTCPIPMWKDGAKWFCHVADVATFIDAQREAARS